MEAELRERNPELRAPAARTAADRDVPHRVPPVVVVAVVEPVRVLLDAGRIDGELERAALSWNESIITLIQSDGEDSSRRVRMPTSLAGSGSMRRTAT